MAYRTKTEKKRALMALKQKSGNLFTSGVLSAGDMTAIFRIADKHLKKL